MSRDPREVKMGLLDRAIAFVSPQTALARMHSKARLVQFGYNDSPWQRGDSGGQGKNGASESWAKHRDRIKAMWDARDQARHDWIGGTLGTMVLYVVGELECKSNTGDPALDALYDDYFHGWCGDDADDDGQIACDATKRHRLIKLVQLAFMAMLVDGDFGFVLKETDGPVSAEGEPTRRIVLQCVEADRIGSPIEAEQSETYIGGLTIDPESGEVASVRVYRRTRMGQYVDPVEVEPQNFIHLFDPERVDEYRGVTSLLRLLEDSRDLRETIEAEKIAIKDQSQYAGTVSTKDPYSDRNAMTFDGKTKAGTPTQKAEWGKWLRLGEGENVNFVTPAARPSGSTLAFWQLLIRRMAKSLKVSYEFLWDMSPLGGVTSRVVVRSDERRFTYWQKLLVDRVLRRVRRVVLDFGVAYDGLPAHPKMRACSWHFGERIITDAGYEWQNDLAMMRAGVTAWDDVATKYSRGGGNLRDIMQRNVASVQGAQELASQGVPIELFAGELMPNATQLLAAMNTPPDEVNPPPPKPGSLEAVGEKGAAQIIDLLTAVATGQMDPESAKEALVTVYGLLPEQAEKIVPKEAVAQPEQEDRGSGTGGRDDKPRNKA